jgi:hypothetical protein
MIAGRRASGLKDGLSCCLRVMETVYPLPTGDTPVALGGDETGHRLAMSHDGDFLARFDPFKEFEEAGPGVESANVGIRERHRFPAVRLELSNSRSHSYHVKSNGRKAVPEFRRPQKREQITATRRR